MQITEETRESLRAMNDLDLEINRIRLQKSLVDGTLLCREAVNSVRALLRACECEQERRKIKAHAKR